MIANHWYYMMYKNVSCTIHAHRWRFFYAEGVQIYNLNCIQPRKGKKVSFALVPQMKLMKYYVEPTSRLTFQRFAFAINLLHDLHLNNVLVSSIAIAFHFSVRKVPDRSVVGVFNAWNSFGAPFSSSFLFSSKRAVLDEWVAYTDRDEYPTELKHAFESSFWLVITRLHFWRFVCKTLLS